MVVLVIHSLNVQPRPHPVQNFFLSCGNCRLRRWILPDEVGGFFCCAYHLPCPIVDANHEDDWQGMIVIGFLDVVKMITLLPLITARTTARHLLHCGHLSVVQEDLNYAKINTVLLKALHAQIFEASVALLPLLMDISPDKQNIDRVFSNTAYFIDFYQRDYRWTDEPVLRLLDDILFKFKEQYARCGSLDHRLRRSRKNTLGIISTPM